VLYQAISGRTSIILVSAFSFLFVFINLLVIQIEFSNGMSYALGNRLLDIGLNGNNFGSLLRTCMTVIGGILALKMWRESISRNDFYRLSRKPFTIGIAGDSGAGKDYLADSIIGLFGSHSVARLSGDDFHLWDRQKPIWQAITHLNPMANDLEGLCKNLLLLKDGKNILSRQYDHLTGKLSKPFVVASNDLIIVTGLHALYLPMLRDCSNLKIYLDIDEGLRRYFKVDRDKLQRGHSVEYVLDSINKRSLDSNSFIRPQSKYADLIFALSPAHVTMVEDVDKNYPLNLKLVVKTRALLNELSLHRVLVGICGLSVDVFKIESDGISQISIEGKTSSDEMELAAKMICPSILEFLDVQPKWQDGMIGVMQLITLIHINQALTKRFL